MFETSLSTTQSFYFNQNYEFYKLMMHAGNREYVQYSSGELVEQKLNLSKNGYSRKNAKHKAADKKTKTKRIAQPQNGAGYYYYVL